jgi:hypothetical protein
VKRMPHGRWGMRRGIVLPRSLTGLTQVIAVA